jgi:hypothetical protein
VPDQHGVLSRITGGEWRGRCNLHFDGRSLPSSLRDRTACRSRFVTIEAYGRRDQVQYGVLSRTVGREWPGRCNLHCDRRSLPPSLRDLTACPGGPYRLPWQDLLMQLWDSVNSSCCCCCYITKCIQPTVTTAIAHGCPGHYSSRPSCDCLVSVQIFQATSQPIFTGNISA